MKIKKFQIIQPEIKHISQKNDEGNDELYITGIANTGTRDLVGDVVTTAALEEIASQAVNRNLHFNHNGNLDSTLEELTESIIGVITESEVTSEGVSITSRILPRHQEHIKYFLDNNVNLGLSISGLAHYEENSFEQIESWDLTEISLTPTPCDQGTMGTVRQYKSFNEFLEKEHINMKKNDNEETVTIEQVEELINTAFNEKTEELLEQVRGELKEEYEVVITELKERIETLESQTQNTSSNDEDDGGNGENGNVDGGNEGEGKNTSDEDDDQEDEEKRINNLVTKKVEETITNIFGKNTPNFKYHEEKEPEKEPENKSYTPRQIAEIITGGH